MTQIDEQALFIEFKNSPMCKVLQTIIGETIDDRLKNFVDNFDRKKENQGFFEIKDICEMFRITPQTFHNWKNRGWIIGRKMGKSRFFTREEVEQAMANYNIVNGKTSVVTTTKSIIKH